MTLMTQLALELYMLSVFYCLWYQQTPTTSRTSNDGDILAAFREKILAEIDQVGGFHKVWKVCEGLVDPSVKGSLGKIPCTLDYAQMQKVLEGSMGDFYIAEKGEHVGVEGKILVEIEVFAMIKD